MVSLRSFALSTGDGPLNMATDEVLVQTAATEGIGSIRFYTWSVATLSLGYFQPAAVRREYDPLTALPWVRRPSGGKTLLHHHELTYALALPREYVSGWMRRMHEQIIKPACDRLGLKGQIRVVEGETDRTNESMCFREQSAGDLICAGHKIVGSAQRKLHGALLQHGSILLARSEYAPQIPGIKDLTGIHLSRSDLEKAIIEEIQHVTGWDTQESKWTHRDRMAIKEQIAAKYGTPQWNEKR